MSTNESRDLPDITTDGDADVWELRTSVGDGESVSALADGESGEAGKSDSRRSESDQDHEPGRARDQLDDKKNSRDERHSREGDSTDARDDRETDGHNIESGIKTGTNSFEIIDETTEVARDESTRFGRNRHGRIEPGEAGREDMDRVGTEVIPNPNGDDAKFRERAVVRFMDDEIASRAESAVQIARMKNSFLLGIDEIQSEKLISSSTIDTPVSNAFRKLRRNVFDYVGRSNPIVLVTGVDDGVGNTFAAKNLAAAIALDEVSTALYVDCNIRRAVDREEDHIGLTDFLESDQIDESEIIQHTGIPRLRRIGAGRRRELMGEYFSSPRIRYLFRSLSMRYRDRAVVIDGPPASTDSAILADIADAVLLVVSYRKSTERQLAKSIAVLGRDKIMGIVFNDQPFVPEYQW